MSFPTVEEVRAGLEAYNRFVAEIWQSKQRELAFRLSALARRLATEKREIRAVEVLELGLDTPPVLEMEGTLDGPGKLTAAISIGGEGAWHLGAQFRVAKGFPPSIRGHRLAVEVLDLRIRVELDIERTSETTAELLGSKVHVHLGDLDFSADNFFWKLFTAIVNLADELLEDLVEDVVRKALQDAVPDVDLVRRIAELGLGSEPPPVMAEPPSLADLEAPAVAVSRRVLEHHMPYGSVFNRLVPRSDPDSPSSEHGFKRFADSAIWTGHVLAGEVFRYRVSSDPAALEAIARLLDGFERLISLTDEPGLLSRLVISTKDDSPDDDLPDLEKQLWQERERVGDEERVFYSPESQGDDPRQGSEWVSMGHITRDQYAGAMLGCGLAATWLEASDGEDSDAVQALRAKARSIAARMIDYLAGVHFCPTEVAPDPETGFKMTSVTYAMDPTQVLAILQLAKRLSLDVGERFAELEKIHSIQWLFHWLQTLDPVDSYYKYNLAHGMNFLLLALEEDAERKGRLASGLRVQRQALRHHGNAYFDLVELLALDGRDDLLSRPRAELEAEAKALVAEAFERPPLIVPVEPPADLETVEMVDFEGRTKRIARQARPVIDRPGADFLWQRSPFDLRVVWEVPEDPAMRSPNADLTLPYWMARSLESA